MPLCLPIAEAAWFPPVQLLSPVTLLLSDGSLPAARQVPPGSQSHQSWKRKSSFPPILSEGWGVFEKANEYSLRLFLYVSPSNSFNYFHTCFFHIFILITSLQVICRIIHLMVTISIRFIIPLFLGTVGVSRGPGPSQANLLKHVLQPELAHRKHWKPM